MPQASVKQWHVSLNSEAKSEFRVSTFSRGAVKMSPGCVQTMHLWENVVPNFQELESFIVLSDDPLVKEHAAVTAWVEDALGNLGDHYYYKEVNLKELPSGENLLAGNPQQSRRFVMAALAQVMHWDRLAERAREQATNELQRINAHHLPGWEVVWSSAGRRKRSLARLCGAASRLTNSICSPY